MNTKDTAGLDLIVYQLYGWLLTKGMIMSRMNEQSQEQDERENISGSDDYEAYMHEQKEKENAENI